MPEKTKIKKLREIEPVIEDNKNKKIPENLKSRDNGVIILLIIILIVLGLGILWLSNKL